MVGKLFRKCGGNGAGVATLAILSITRAVSPSRSQPPEKKEIQNQFRFFLLWSVFTDKPASGEERLNEYGDCIKWKTWPASVHYSINTKNTSGIEVATQHKLHTLPPPLSLLTLLTALTLSKQCMPLYVYC